VLTRRSVQLLPRDPCLHGRGEVGRPDLEDPVEPGQIEADPTPDRDHVPLDARPRSERDDRHTPCVRELEYPRHFIHGSRIDDDVRPVRPVQAEVGGVEIEDGFPDADAALVRDELQERRSEDPRGRDRHRRRIRRAAKPTRPVDRA
jgi:hypothetical protein